MRKTSWHDLLRPGEATDFFSRGTFPPFDPSASGYNAGNALWLMELSRLVYRHDIEEENAPPQPTRVSFLVKAGLKQRRFFLSRKTGTQAMLVESADGPSFAVLAFRGTEQEIKDFLTDLEVGIQQLSHDSPGVHEGFEEAIDSVWSDVEAELAKLSCPVYYTGHSLGAALATLAAARQRPAALYTFGSPRVGNALFAASFANLPVHRVVDDKDAVAHLPPRLMGFEHVGELHLLKQRGGWYGRSLIAWARRFFGHPPKELADHAPVNYLDRIMKQVSG